MKNLMKRVLLSIAFPLVLLTVLQADLIDKANLLSTKLDCQINIVSCYNTGIYYRDGFGTEKDPVKALEYFKKACKEGKGYMDACFSIGHINEFSDYGLNDWGIAVRYYKMAADAGDIDALGRLDYLYSTGGINLMVDKEKAIFYGRLACNKGRGNSDSCYLLAGNLIATDEDLMFDGKEILEAIEIFRHLCVNKKDGRACHYLKIYED